MTIIDTTNLHQRLVVCPDGEIRQLIGYDDKENPEFATVTGEKGRAFVFKVEDLKEVEK